MLVLPQGVSLEEAAVMQTVHSAFTMQFNLEVTKE
jgi:hypothetical protein